jgi:L-alanine-DL-glutamate epimerase-like enolase superfamily enzyme
MKVQHDVSIVHTTHPFVIARGGASEHRLIRVRLIDDDGVEGWGEASPNRFYGETVDTALGALSRLAPIVERCDPWALEDAELEMNRALRLNGSVKSAISAALHDLAAKRLGSVVQAVGTRSAKAPLSASRSGSPRPTTNCASAWRAAEYPVLKSARHGSRRADHSHGAPGGAVKGAASTPTRRGPPSMLAMIDVLRRVRRGIRGAAASAHDLDGCASFANVRRFPVIADEVVRRVDGRRASRWRR